VSISTTGSALPEFVDPASVKRLHSHLGEALRRARAGGDSVVASVSAPTRVPVDPTAIVAASRADGEAWFCVEEPDRDHSAVAAIGSALELRAAGPQRFNELAGRWQTVASRAVCDPPAGPPGSGLVAVGGFAFAPEGGTSPRWDDFAPGSLTVPEASLSRIGEQSWLSLNLGVAPDDTSEDLDRRLQIRLASLSDRPLPMLDPAPAGRYRVHSPMPPSHFEEAVAGAVSRIRAGELEKLVLAREVEVTAPVAYDPAAIAGVLRDGFPACFTFVVGRGAASFLGASPELLVRREGMRASTVALAGSIRRSADPSVDRHLGEQLLLSAKDRHEHEVVARRIARALSPHSVWVTVAPEPMLVQVANIQHLATPIRAQLTQPVSAIELAGLLHPTPAVGGEPNDVAELLIPAFEGFDRGWYTGVVGWTDSIGDGEFCVALRCALLRGTSAWCYAGGGIVADSDPAAELAETEVKLQALLPLLSG
jgi:salicylate biosynthesis isochorismate synthase